ncbi:6e505f15-09fb-4678-8dbf-8b1208611190-CDS [Sclerotinia trifoliorum]|uniref:6e505f15-09fb-4678-8dbf-8b1208611190-CDS n=1 Tax=Sclerotinia trifoliorum TaxID=28548 RepID=A0A8H2ZTZ5_9HELO|nr:6e505f15-09fb-4678-8dbf-8b1208611190-CDS [Sclerotinia trifoliorum]
MPASLGKRKRTSATIPISSKLLKVSKTTPIIPEPIPEPQSEEEASDSSPDDDDDEDDEDDTEPLDSQEIFRRHFEAQFKPLTRTVIKSKASQTIDDAENEEVDDWEGLSENSSGDDEEQENGVQIVEHVKKVDSRIAGMSKAELRAFMSSKIPKSLPTPSLSKLQEPIPGSADDPGATEALNLKNDLALQRLLDESHLLTSSSSSSSANSHLSHTLQGKNRLKALDLRVQALGGKTSIHKQESMPMAMRKGIVKKAEEKEERRRREARENGVVLETKGGRGGGSGGRERRKERSGGRTLMGRCGKNEMWIELRKSDVRD